MTQRQATGLTIYYPKYAPAGCRFRRAADQTPIDLRDDTTIRRHTSMAQVVAELQMVCANPHCGHALGS